MKFKLGRTDVVISFSFLALVLLALVTKSNPVLVESLAVSALHECVHLLFIRIFKGSISLIRFSFMGGEIKRGDNTLTSLQEAVISLSAPVTNVLTGTIFLLFTSYRRFGIVNLLVGIFNLIPYHSFDGGRALEQVLQGRVSEGAARLILLTTSIITCFSFIAINVYMLKKSNGSPVLLITSLIMLILLVFRVISRGKQV